MRKSLRFWFALISTLLLVSLLLAGCGTTTASGPQTYLLPAGQTDKTDLRILAGNAVLETGSRLDGSVYMTSGRLEIGPQAHVEQDIILLSGELILAEQAFVGGDVVMFSGRLKAAENAAIQGELTSSVRRFLNEVVRRLLSQIVRYVCLPLTAVLLLILAVIVYLRRRRKTRIAPAPALPGQPADAPASESSSPDNQPPPTDGAARI